MDLGVRQILLCVWIMGPHTNVEWGWLQIVTGMKFSVIEGKNTMRINRKRGEQNKNAGENLPICWSQPWASGGKKGDRTGAVSLVLLSLFSSFPPSFFFCHSLRLALHPSHFIHLRSLFPSSGHVSPFQHTLPVKGNLEKGNWPWKSMKT